MYINSVNSILWLNLLHSENYSDINYHCYKGYYENKSKMLLF
jgi:hypothetical protein